MDWLKDKKNQPIVAAGLAVIIIGAVVAVYFTQFAGEGAPPPDTSATTTAPPTTETAAMPTDAGAPGPPGGPPTGAPMGTPAPAPPGGAAPGTTAPAGTATAAAPAPTPPGGAVPMEVWRPDPFLPAGYRPRITTHKPKPPIPDLRFTLQNWSRFVSERTRPPEPDLPQPVRRMAGLIVSDRIYAIIDTAGKSEIVQPGDILGDRMAMVERIERDKVVLKTMDKHPKYLTVRMASAPRTETPTTPSGTGAEPFGPRPPGGPYRGGPGRAEPMQEM